jgi:UDP-N-acetylglucosamine/UDP-N-acetylgalactosamine diphosphorylase
VAVVVVAGGQGTRLGYDAPKGTFPIGPVSHATLFQIHAEKIAALERRYGCVIPWFVMTSPANHDDTAAFFTRHADFGLERVRLFVQGQMPAVHRASGHLLLSERDHLALSPDGHGGTLRALAAPGPEGEPSCLDEMRQRGIRSIFYFQVDNALVRVADPLYLGLHLEAHAEVSAKVVEKVDPFEKVGLVVEVDGRPGVIEYSDLPGELAERRRADGRLELSAGSIAIHVFERTFVERIVSGAAALPFHRADKKVPFLDDQGALVEPDSPNAVKFETFIFDTLPLAARVVVVETDRYEFQPLKNASGADSPASVRAAMVELHTSWVEQAGARVRRNAEGTPVPIEISPLYALEVADVVARPPAILDIDRPLYLR